MTEVEWQGCGDPSRMIGAAPFSDRRMRLYMVAVCRRVADLFPAPVCEEAVGVAERAADPGPVPSTRPPPVRPSR